MPLRMESPAEARNVFGNNLRTLTDEFGSVSKLSQKLGINRTQLNRYLSGDSFPRPDVLKKICAFFDVDARILLEPVETVRQPQDALQNPFLKDFLNTGATDLPKSTFTSGFYRFSRRSFLKPDQFVSSIVLILRDGRRTFLRGLETRDAMRSQGLPLSSVAREFRGIVLQQDEGIAILVSRRNVLTCSFNYLHRVASLENNFWAGYVTRTTLESRDSMRITRLVYEYLGQDVAKALPAARLSGSAI